MNRLAQRARDFVEFHSVQHNCFVTLQHLPRYAHKLTCDALARLHEILARQQARNRNVAAK